MADIKWTDEQRSAIELRGRSVLVCAAAGSGKTATLTQRIIERLTDENEPADISRLLIVTFTRAAASELREKIYTALSSALEADPHNSRLAFQMMKLPSARISTIHSFCYDIIKKNTAKLGIRSGVKIADATETVLLKKRIINECISDFYESRDVIFLSLSECLTNVKGEGNLGQILLEIYDYLLSYAEGVETVGKFGSELFDAIGKDFFDTAHGKVLAEIISDETDSHIVRLSGIIRELTAEDKEHPYLGAFCRDLDAAKRLKDALGAGYSSVRQLFLSHSFEKMKSASKSKYDENNLINAKKVRDDFKKFFARESDAFSYDKAALEDATAKTAALTSVLSDVLCEFDRRFLAEKAEMGLVDYGDLEHFALKLLYDGDKLTDTAREIAEVTDEIYIDEYQDVNEVQDKIFHAVSSGRNLFMVGDVKQSIYNFRGADPSIFITHRDNSEKYSPESDSDAPCTVFMKNNFRCDNKVVNYVNKIFECVLGKSNGRFRYIREDELVYTKDGGKISESEVDPRLVLCQRCDGDEDESYNPEIEFVCDEIVRLLSGECKNNGERITPKDIVVLFRSDKNIAPKYKRALEQRGVPTEITEKISPFDSKEVQLVLCLLNSIDNPHRDIYLCGALLSEIYGFCAEDLVRIKREFPLAVSLYDALVQYTEAHDFLRGRAFLEKNEELKKMSRKVSSDKLIWKIYTDTSFIPMLCAQKSTAYEKKKVKRNCMFIYELARNFEAGAFRGLYGFLEYVNGMIRSEENIGSSEKGSDDAVRLMSVHTSKGLEFPVCFLSNTASAFNKVDHYKRIICEHDVGIGFKLRGDDGFLLVDTPYRYALSRYGEMLDCEEQMRILYVALTRARERLYITANANSRLIPDAESAIERARFAAEYFTKTSVRSLNSFADAVLLATFKENIPVYPEVVNIDSRRPISNYNEGVGISGTETESVGESDVRSSYETIKSRVEYAYPFEKMTKIRAKMSVSKLHPTVLDVSLDDAADISDRALDFSRSPDFDMTDKAPDAAEIGTATHLVMQFADFERICEYGVRAELERLLAEGFIDSRTRLICRAEDIERFTKSGFYKRIASSKKLRREFRFNLYLDASHFTEDKDLGDAMSGEGILVQGVIDGFFIEGEDIVLFDYKTDSLTEYEISNTDAAEKKLIDRHRQQLYYYKLALERIFSKKVSEVYIYSLVLGREIRVDFEDQI